MRSKYTLDYIPYGHRALLINWPSAIAPEILYDIIALNALLTHEAILERVIAYHSLTLIFHQPQERFDFWINHVDELYHKATQYAEISPTIHKIPVCYDPELAPDLVPLCADKNMSIKELITAHSAPEYLVYFIGFQPGFVYMGGLNPKLKAPRKSTPSPFVAQGSVAIGGAQTGIYPADAPGGWHVIGRTYLDLFDPLKSPACAIKSGDLIKFIPIAREEFEHKQSFYLSSSDPISEFNSKKIAVFKLLKSGIYSSLQDLGRHGHRAVGVVQSGAMDQISARLANALVGNAPREAVLEITYGGAQLECLYTCKIALTGADFSAQLNDLPINMNRVIPLKKGDILALGQRKTGARTYMAIEHGFDAELVMGSRSFYGPVTGTKRFIDGDLLYRRIDKQDPNETSKETLCLQSHLLPETADFNPAQRLIDFSISKPFVLQASPGPEHNTLRDSVKNFINQEFTIGANDRMGYLLRELIKNDCPAIYSSAVLPGTVQLTPGGQVIILTNDGQVTGGYPRILQLSDESLSQLGQLITGQKIRFNLVSNI